MFQKHNRVHVLVAMAFLDFKPNKQVLTIDHKNGVRTDNRLENLQIVTQRENNQNYHKSKKGKIWSGIGTNKQKNGVQEFISIKILFI